MKALRSWLFTWFGGIPCLRCRVLVNLTDQKTAIRGVLWQHRGGWLVLKQAECITADAKGPVVMDGDVILACDKVLFTQVVS